MRKTMKRLLTATLGALAFVAAGLGVSALKTVDVAKAENENLKIAGKTLNVSDNVNVVFYVPVSAGDKSAITVHVTEKESTGDVESTLTADDTDYINEGKTYYRFVYRGVTAYEMENELIAYAELNGDVSPSVKYSILEYAYKKLGKADKEKDTTEGLEDLLKATLNYGSAAAKYKNKTLPADFSYEDDYTYVSVANAKFADGFSHGVFKKGDKLDVKPDEDYKLSINAGSSFVDNGDGTVTLTVPNGKLNDTGSFVHKDTEEEQEATEFATFELGANGSASHYDGSEKSTYTETVNGYTLSIIGGSKMYTGARDAKGNSCIKFGTDSAVGQCMFIVPEDVTEVVICVAKYKAKTSKVSINGGAATTLTSASDNGEYDTIIVDTTTNKTVEVATTSGGNRAMLNTIVFKGIPVSATDKVAAVVSEVEAMTFDAVTATGDVQLPTAGTSYPDVGITWDMNEEAKEFASIENGTLTIKQLPEEDVEIELTATVFCEGIQQPAEGITILVKQAVVDEPATPTTATLSFADKAQRTSFSENQQVWEQNGITFTNNKAASTSPVANYANPVRLYKSSEIVIGASGNNITKIVFTCNSASYATALKESIGDSATVSGSAVTVELEAVAEYKISSLTAQVRINSMEVTYLV